MKHPNPKIQKNQDDFLKNCSDKEREFHARIFRIGNATIHYHKLAATSSMNKAKFETFYQDWLKGLPDNIREVMEKKGLKGCRSILSFTRYVNERNDFGIAEWMKTHLSAEDYDFYAKQKE